MKTYLYGIVEKEEEKITKENYLVYQAWVWKQKFNTVKEFKNAKRPKALTKKATEDLKNFPYWKNRFQFLGSKFKDFQTFVNVCSTRQIKTQKKWESLLDEKEEFTKVFPLFPKLFYNEFESWEELKLNEMITYEEIKDETEYVFEEWREKYLAGDNPLYPTLPLYPKEYYKEYNEKDFYYFKKSLVENIKYFHNRNLLQEWLEGKLPENTIIERGYVKHPDHVRTLGYTYSNNFLYIRKGFKDYEDNLFGREDLELIARTFEVKNKSEWETLCDIPIFENCGKLPKKVDKSPDWISWQNFLGYLTFRDLTIYLYKEKSLQNLKKKLLKGGTTIKGYTLSNIESVYKEHYPKFNAELFLNYIDKRINEEETHPLIQRMLCDTRRFIPANHKIISPWWFNY